MASKFDFDQVVERNGTDSVKFDGCEAQFGAPGILPMWVADMDFAAPEAVRQALLARVSHPIYGYTQYSEPLYDAVIGWMRRRHHWAIEKDWVLFTPGVVPALHAAIMAYSEPGAGVIVQTPVYYPFMSAVALTGRRLILNPLELKNGRYQMNLSRLESCAKAGARVLLLCSPHNPVGRVWSRRELLDLLAITEKYGIVVVSDEIHHDLIYPGNQHSVLANLSEDPARIVTAVAPSKTFNIPGLGLSCVIISDPERRARFNGVMERLGIAYGNPLSIVGFRAAYTEGDPWLSALLNYLNQNKTFAIDQIRKRCSGIEPIEPEGTYLLWLDCRKLGLSDEELKRFFVEKARVGLMSGIVYGEGGSGYMRMNIGTPRARVSEAIERMAAVMN